jgi:hypothetical protein
MRVAAACLAAAALLALAGPGESLLVNGPPAMAQAWVVFMLVPKKWAGKPFF